MVHVLARVSSHVRNMLSSRIESHSEFYKVMILGPCHTILWSRETPKFSLIALKELTVFLGVSRSWFR